jgi:hypothetical protein
MLALIDVILNQPGGFAGEIILAEHVHRDPTTALNGSYCWNMSAGYNRTNNWPDMSYEGYAGPTSAVKCHIGFIEGTSLHSVGYNAPVRPDAMGESGRL